MLNVLLIYYEPAPSGQTTHVLSIVRALGDRIRATVVLPSHLRRSIAAFRQSGAQVVPLPMHKLAWPPGTVIALGRLIRRQRIDVVHIHSQEAGLLGRIVARMSRAPSIVYTPQTTDIRRARWQRLYTTIERLLSGITDVIVSVNEADRERLIRHGFSPHKVVSIPNGIDLYAFTGEVDVGSLRQELGVDPNRPVVMQVARLSAQKDPLTFVDGAAHVLRMRPDVQFVLVGEGPLRETVQAHIRELDLGNHVHLLGWRDNARRLTAAADVVTLTSRWEGTPYSLLEAMAWSRPVVATSVNGCPEIIVERVTGFLVPPGDAAAWARRVTALLNDPAMAAAMGEQGRRRVEGRFSLQEMAVRLENLYHQVTGAATMS